MERVKELETSLLERLAAERWREGLRCPRCGGQRCVLHMRLGAGGRRKLKCSNCGRSFNDLTGTPFARSHLPLSSWFVAAGLMALRTPTCADIARRLDIKVSTAWRVRRVLTRALADPLLRRVLASQEALPCA
ncbi:MAG: IS1 family transposase [Elusimicrobia bacterium]|nr:IS1 family transposase [Elusimicrobiota bacterium]